MNQRHNGGERHSGGRHNRGEAQALTPPGPEQDRDLPLDSHLHTDLSPDSDVTIDLYCAEAVARGIPEIAITDHLDFDPRDPAYEYADFPTRERVVRQAAERWADRGLAVRFGVELTYGRPYEDDIRDHLRRHRYDFTIGSVHDWPDSPYRDRARFPRWVAGRSLSGIVAPYFDEVMGAARSGLFDTIGHLDVVKRYLTPDVTVTDLDDAPELYEPVLRAIVDSGCALEVNTSGLRQEIRETYPSPAIVELFRELGGVRVTIGSDAHRIQHFAYGLGQGYQLVERAGFRVLAFRRGEERVEIELPHATVPWS
jgi:histidinol-phosphatase (PHP family)